jgi:DNA polymerase-3 subunit gamma/tau
MPSMNTPAAQDYVVLARRYRPRLFDEVIGQEHVTRTLANAITAGRVHHAYLFTGCRGVGKTTVARIMARALNCVEGPTPTPCGRCEICTQMSTAVDILEIDGASHTGVDDVRELREAVRYLPAQARKKIYIIDEVHMLSTSAFNALLKTLEEPPPHVVFIFATTEPHKIPATILSRCQRFDFKRVRLANLVSHLKHLLEAEQISVEEGGLYHIARAAEGSVRDALSLLDQVIAYARGQAITTTDVAQVLGVADRRAHLELSSTLLGRNADAGLDLVQRLYQDGQDLSQFAQSFLHHLRDLIVVRTCKEPGPLVETSAAELTDLRTQAQGPGAELLEQHFALFARVAEEISRSNAPRLLLEMAVVEMAQAEPLVPLGDLLQRLELLELRLGDGGGPSGAAGPSSSTRRTASVPSSPPAKPVRRLSPNEQVTAAFASASGVDAASAAAQHDRATERPTAVPGAAPQMLECWKSLLTDVEQREPVSASAYYGAQLLSFAPERIELGYPPGSFELQRAAQSDRLAGFRAHCAAILGRELQIVVRGLTERDRESPVGQEISLLASREQEQRARVDKLRREAETHPITRALVDAFGASIDRVRTAADEEHNR